ncbi:MAG: DUF4229 domain-containing protein [Streptosporangiales bacterium]|nr:DUF4229 domain-containing protein [Streptosporangiales bacterium]
MGAFLKYMSARVALFLGCWGLMWLLGAKGVLGVLLGLIVSGLLSYVVLHRIRDRFAAALSGGVRGLRQRMRSRSDEPATDATAKPAEPES